MWRVGGRKEQGQGSCLKSGVGTAISMFKL